MFVVYLQSYTQNCLLILFHSRIKLFSPSLICSPRFLPLGVASWFLLTCRSSPDQRFNLLQHWNPSSVLHSSPVLSVNTSFSSCCYLVSCAVDSVHCLSDCFGHHWDSQTPPLIRLQTLTSNKTLKLLYVSQSSASGVQLWNHSYTQLIPDSKI